MKTLPTQTDLDETVTAATVQLDRDGCVLLSGVLSVADTVDLAETLSMATGRAEASTATLRGQAGRIYGVRNLQERVPQIRSIWKCRPLYELLRAVLGPELGLVRVLYFDKPPGQSWALPWHRDLTIAVRENTSASEHFRHPTIKAGVPHVEAPDWLLGEMLTARIHLDASTPENGPLRVLPGSHRTGRSLDGVAESEQAHTVLSAAGDVFLMRPLLAHCSGRSSPATTQHRRVLHLEFAARPTLPDGFEWHTFLT